jgi:hypothetical protein
MTNLNLNISVDSRHSYAVVIDRMGKVCFEAPDDYFNRSSECQTSTCYNISLVDITAGTTAHLNNSLETPNIEDYNQLHQAIPIIQNCKLPAAKLWSLLSAFHSSSNDDIRIKRCQIIIYRSLTYFKS